MSSYTAAAIISVIRETDDRNNNNNNNDNNISVIRFSELQAAALGGSRDDH